MDYRLSLQVFGLTPLRLLVAMLILLATSAIRADKLAAESEENAEGDPAVRVEFTQDGRTRDVVGRIAIEAADGGMLLEGDDGVLWTIQPKEVLSRKDLVKPFKPLSADEL